MRKSLRRFLVGMLALVGLLGAIVLSPFAPVIVFILLYSSEPVLRLVGEGYKVDLSYVRSTDLSPVDMTIVSEQPGGGSLTFRYPRAAATNVATLRGNGAYGLDVEVGWPSLTPTGALPAGERTVYIPLSVGQKDYPKTLKIKVETTTSSEGGFHRAYCAAVRTKEVLGSERFGGLRPALKWKVPDFTLNLREGKVIFKSILPVPLRSYDEFYDLRRPQESSTFIRCPFQGDFCDAHFIYRGFRAEALFSQVEFDRWREFKTAAVNWLDAHLTSELPPTPVFVAEAAARAKEAIASSCPEALAD